mmetsp:Transcript_45443/g.51300  ORF Transcript_45443/g.51300 Transcript_45443/m.51300 type:complete len:109 (-) Transcript_45443:50-376(-)
MKNCNHLFTCPNCEATKVYNKNLEKLHTKLEKLITVSELKKAIISDLKCGRSGTNPTLFSFGSGSFGGGVTLADIIYDQVDIEWINFFVWKIEREVKRGSEDTLLKYE